MNKKSLLVIVIVSFTLAVLVFLILRLLNLTDNTAIVGGIIGGVVGALFGNKLNAS